MCNSNDTCNTNNLCHAKTVYKRFLSVKSDRLMLKWMKYIERFRHPSPREFWKHFSKNSMSVTLFLLKN